MTGVLKKWEFEHRDRHAQGEIHVMTQEEVGYVKDRGLA